MNRMSLALSTLALVAIAFAQPAAAALTSVVTDPVGDACCNSKHLAYRDIVGAEITKQGRTFFFGMEMAGPIPETLEFPAGAVDFVVWLWGLDTNSETSPAGFPFAPGAPARSEYFIWIMWDGVRFAGQLIDRTPLLTGGEATVTPLAITIEGAEFKTSVDAAMVADPSAFLWIVRTGDSKKPLGTAKSATSVDIAPDNAPDGSHVFAPWPS